MREGGMGVRMAGLMLLVCAFMTGELPVLGLHISSGKLPGRSAPSLETLGGGRIFLAAEGRTARPRLGLRGGGISEDEEDSEDTRAVFRGKAAKVAGEGAAAVVAVSEVKKDTDAAEEKEGEQANEALKGEEEEAEVAGEEETVAERPPLEPEMVRKMNKMLWEAAIDGNEPLVDKALKNGANVNAFCRGPEKWLNISVGEIAGADEGSTGLNCHWMELNNYTALHLAAASGNAGIIDKLVESGADINVECLQRVHPMPTSFGIKLPFFSTPSPLIFKCTALRLARAANCGRCFFTSYAKSVDKLVAYGAIDKDFHFPLNTVILGGAFLLAYLGINKWPYDWFKEWPEDWANYPDMAVYGAQR